METSNSKQTARKLLRYRLAVLALEVAFWTPFWLLPYGIRLWTGQRTAQCEPFVSVYISAVLGFIGAQLGRRQVLYRALILIFLTVGSVFSTGLALAQFGLPSPNIMLAVIDTNRQEGSEFFRQFLSGRDYAIAALEFVPAGVFFLQWRRKLFWSPRPKAVWWLFALLLLQITVLYAVRPRHGFDRKVAWIGRERLGQIYPAGWYPPLKPYLQLVQAFRIRREVARLAAAPNTVTGVEAVEPPGGPRTYVVIVGESLAKGHMHLYGYGRPTTPMLDELRRRGELLVFEDAASSHAQTGTALMDALTWGDSSRAGLHTIIDLFNSAGFLTCWISNQQGFGAINNIAALLTSHAAIHSCTTASAAQSGPATFEDKDEKEVEVVSNSAGWFYDPLERRRANFDDALLPRLSNVLKQDKRDKLVFLHLMGSHAVARARFPRSAEYFGAAPGAAWPLPAEPRRSAEQKQAINDYDDSVRFNDSVVGRIIEEVRAAGGESFVVYFSDHGEEVYDFRNMVGHSDEVPSPIMLEIPFVVWLSDEYRSKHPAFAAGLQAGVKRPYMNSNFPASLADLARLKHPELKRARSLFSREFEPTVRMAIGRDYDAFKRSWAPDAAHANGIALLPCNHNQAQAMRPAALGRN